MKLLVVRSSKSSTWGSCKVISPNLQKAYELLPEIYQVKWFDLPADFLSSELDSCSDFIHDLAKTIIADRPDQLVFIDHLPHPAEILSKLSLILEVSKLPPVSVHVYGDFTYFSKDWLEISSRFLNHPIRFITASHSQKKLVDYFCEDKSNVEQFLFPVNTEDYFFDQSARTKLRKEMKIEDCDMVLLYSGRVSLQKNVDLLLQEYLELIKDESVKVHLWIAGGFDDLGAPFMGLKTTEGYLYSKIQNIINRHPKHFTANIKFWGNLNKTQLRELQSAADLFTSFSLYHDEDFGMSPAEALACGLPSLLSDWGGYSSFESTKWRCKLAPVKITEYGLQIKTSALKDFFSLQKESYVGEADRERWAGEFAKSFSIASSSKVLADLLTKPVSHFKGFNWTLAPFSQIYSKQHRSQSIDPNTCPSDKNFYAQVYRNYISSEAGSSDHFKVVNWTYDYILNSQMDAAMPAGKKIRPVHFYLKPFSNDYVGPHSPVLLGGTITKKLLNKNLWSLRDGLITQSFFFREHSPEKGVQFAVPSDFWFIVPEQWKENTLFYEVQAQKKYNLQNPPARILLAGMQNNVFADTNEFNKSLIELKNSLGEEALTRAKITAFFPYKKNNLWGKRCDEETFSIAQSILKTTGLNITFVEWKDLKNENDFKECLYYEINQKYFVADSYLKHFILSKGGGLIEEQTLIPKKEISHYMLSPHHSVKIFQPDWLNIPVYKDPFKSDYFAYFKEVCNGQVKSIRISPFWESWYPLYLKKFYSLFPPESKK